jgi:hypothetical protein
VHRILTVLLLALALCTACLDHPASPPPASDGGGIVRDGGSTGADGGSADAGTADDGGIVASPSTCNPLRVTEECLPPFPSDLLTRRDDESPTGHRLVLPQGALVTPQTQIPIDITPYNAADGFPTTVPIIVHLGVLLDEALLTGVHDAARSLDGSNPIAIFEAETGRRIPFLSEMDANATDPARTALIIRPLEPLGFATRYIVALTRALRTGDGTEPPPSRGFVALRDGTPAADPRLEAARPRYEALFAFLELQGIAREDLYLAWEYTTASRERVLGPILNMREEVFRRSQVPGGIPFTVDRVDEAPNANVSRIVYGTFSPPNYLRDDNTIDFGPSGPVLQAAARSYPYTLVIPARADRDRVPLPLVLFGHGVFGNGRDYLSGNIGVQIVQPLAENSGGIVVATDWIGLSSADLALILTDVVPNVNRIGLVTDRLLQSLVNNLALIELTLGELQADDRVRLDATSPLLDDSRVFYYGVSLGGIQGSSLVSVSRHVSRAVVSVPGASWSNLLPRSVVYSPVKNIVDMHYPDPLLQVQFLSLLQFRFDPTDGANLATLFSRHPLPDAPEGRRLLIQEAIGDCEVPNLSTEILARAFGVRQLTPAVVPIFGLVPTPTPTEEDALAQYELTDHLMSYTPPDTNTIPAMDNNTHSDSVALPQALQQVTDFLGTGTIVQHCTGACDPD